LTTSPAEPTATDHTCPETQARPGPTGVAAAIHCADRPSSSRRPCLCARKHV
jgi:hypothetical protein